MTTTARNFVEKWGKDKVNTLTKFPSILTYHKLGERGMLLEETTTDLTGEDLYLSEKLDGTNVRLLIFQDGSYLIGSRDTILYASGDLYFDPSMDIVESIHKIVNFDLIRTEGSPLTVIYGELYGGKIGNNGKNYSATDVAFNVFDVAMFPPDTYVDYLMSLEIQKLSQWREHSFGESLAYGQPFLPVDELNRFCIRSGLNMIYPYIYSKEFIEKKTVQEVSEWLNWVIRRSAHVLDETGRGQPEGVVVRNADRSKIVKIRFEDYQRTLTRRK